MPSSPVIAVTGKRVPGPDPSWQVEPAYLAAAEGAGGQPFAIQSVAQLEKAAGLLLTGGGDVAPWRFGRRPHPQIGRVDEERDALELALLAQAIERDLPVLAICRGMQLLVVRCGGTLWQDLPCELPHALNHGQGCRPAGSSARTSHLVLLVPGALAARAAGAIRLEVNSRHHQAAQVVSAPLVASGWAADGIIEAVELPGALFVLGVQWHPENMLDRREHRRLFSAFIRAARTRAAL